MIMKPNKIFLTLIAAALLPAFAYAGTDMISASSERGPHCNLATTTVVVANMDKKADPLEEAVNAAVNSTSDPVLASYYRDLYRAPASFKTVQFVRMADPYADSISMALYGLTEPDSRLVC